MEPAGTELSYETQRTLTAIVDGLTIDIGRLNRRATDDSSLALLAERLAHHIETLDCIAHPCAAELYQTYLAHTGSQAADVAIEEALAVVTARQRTLRARLGLDADGHRKPSQPALLEAAAA